MQPKYVMVTCPSCGDQQVDARWVVLRVPTDAPASQAVYAYTCPKCNVLRSHPAPGPIFAKLVPHVRLGSFQVYVQDPEAKPSGLTPMKQVEIDAFLMWLNDADDVVSVIAATGSHDEED